MLTALKFSVLFVIAVTEANNAQAQVPQTNQEKKTDTVAQRVIRYFNRRQADSVYALTGEDFKKQVPHATWKDIAEKQLLLMFPFKNPVFKNVSSACFSLTHQPVFNDGTNKVGLAWHYLPAFNKVLQHGGGTGGYRTMICIDPEKNIVLVLLTNNATNADALGIQLMQALERTTF